MWRPRLRRGRAHIVAVHCGWAGQPLAGRSNHTHRYLNGVGNHLRQFHIGIVLLEYGHIGAGVQRKQTRTACLRKISAHIFPDFVGMAGIDALATQLLHTRYARKFDSRFVATPRMLARCAVRFVCCIYNVWAVFCVQRSRACVPRSKLAFESSLRNRRWPDGNWCSAFAQKLLAPNKNLFAAAAACLHDQIVVVVSTTKKQ